MIFLIILGIIILGLLLANIRIVSQSEAYVIERLGAYKETWGTGIHWKIPIIDSIVNKVSLKEIVVDFPPQSVITKDNVTVAVDSVIYYQILDPKLFTYGAENPLIAIKNLTATTLRNLIGELELDQTLTSRDIVNSKLRDVLDEASDAWGIKVNRVELKDIIPPESIRQSMEKQMKAERDRREAILTAEGTKQSQILIAEGNKQSIILQAQAQKESAILQAEAEKEAEIRRAEGEAEAIRLIQQAVADGIEMINSANATPEFIQIKALEALEKVANGRSTKLIIPSEIQNLAGLVGSLKEVSNTIDEEPNSSDLSKEKRSKLN